MLLFVVFNFIIFVAVHFIINNINYEYFIYNHKI